MAVKDKSELSGSIKKEVAPPVIKAKINVVRIQSLIDAHLKYTGRVSGKQYEWPKAGTIVNVMEEDVSDLLSKHLGAGSCCGGEGSNQIFQLAS